MGSWIDDKYIGLKIRIQKFAEEFVKEEQGVSAFIATVLLILIVVLLCAILWKYISDWFEKLWGSITKAGDTIKTDKIEVK